MVIRQVKDTFLLFNLIFPKKKYCFRTLKLLFMIENLIHDLYIFYITVV